MSTITKNPAVQILRESLPDVDLDKPLTLADAIRAGSTVTEHNTQGWGAGERVCALSAAAIAAAAWGYA